MREIRLSIDEKYWTTFLAFLKTLNYIKVVKTTVSKPTKETIAEGFRRAAKDSEMMDLADEGLGDYINLLDK